MLPEPDRRADNQNFSRLDFFPELRPVVPLPAMLRHVGLYACSDLMIDKPHALDGNKWYDRTVVEAQLVGATVDLILVDGPIAYTQEKRLARYPALPNIADRLSGDCAIFLDDVRRSGEREIAERWAKEFGLTFEYHTSRGGYAKAVRGNAFYAAF